LRLHIEAGKPVQPTRITSSCSRFPAVASSVAGRIYHAPLVSRLCGIVTAGLQVGNAVLIVALKSHRDRLVQALSESGVDVRKHARQSRFVMYDAEETLATFMHKNKLRRDLFRQSVGRLLREARNNSRSSDRGLTVFGEMVAVLWKQGRKKQHSNSRPCGMKR